MLRRLDEPARLVILSLYDPLRLATGQQYSVGEVRNDVEQAAKSTELSGCKASNRHRSMRRGQISIAFAPLDSPQFTGQFTLLKFSSIYGGYQLGGGCSNLMSFDVLG